MRCLGGSRGEEGHLQDNKKSSRCSVVSSFPCPINGSEEVFLVITLIVDKALNLNSLRER